MVSASLVAAIPALADWRSQTLETLKPLKKNVTFLSTGYKFFIIRPNNQQSACTGMSSVKKMNRWMQAPLTALPEMEF